jgi:hypothetical protein
VRAGLTFVVAGSALLAAGFAGCTLAVELPEAGTGGNAQLTTSGGGEGGSELECASTADCPDPGLACEVPFCVGGECGTVAVPNESPPAIDVGDEDGDCVVAVCDGGGQVIIRADAMDLPAPRECTDYECLDGALATTHRNLGDACSLGQCDGAGSCVECLEASDCTMIVEDECQARACVAGQCVADPTPVGFVVNAALQQNGDCNVRVCDGAGAMMDIADDDDVLDDGLDCTSEYCSGGSLFTGNVAATTPCGTQGQCNGMGQCVGCLAPDDCSGQDSFCQVRTCVANVCGVSNTAVGTSLPPADQTANDCVELQCDGNGGVAPVPLDGDLPLDDGNQCTDEQCASGVPTHPDLPINTVCSQGGGKYCDGTGSCVECNAAGHCDVAPECQVAACVSHQCQTDPVLAGTPAPAQTPYDCRLRVCDGMGGVSTQNQDADVPYDANQCTGDVCTAGVPSNPNSPAGTACTQMGGNACDGSGVCVECTNDSHCPSNQYCNGNSCSADRSTGSSCTRAAMCSTNFCVDGFCCNSSCGGTCKACSSAKTGGANGTCANVRDRTDPDNECGDSDDVCYGGGCCADSLDYEQQAMSAEPIPLCP